MLYIMVPDENDSISQLTIGDTDYHIRFTYNETYDYWSFGLYDADEIPVIAMTRIVPNFPLFHFYAGESLPDGAFGCISDTEKVGREAFNAGTAEFVFIPYDEMDTEPNGRD